MKKKIIFLSLFAGLSLSACEDLVEVEPQTAIASDTALSSLGSYEAVLVSAYDRMQAFNYWGRDFALLGDALADNIYTQSALDGRYVNANRNVTGSHYNIWNTGYDIINDLNTIIATIDDLSVPASQEEGKVQVKAQALALRAMTYFDLARVYGYEPNNIVEGWNKSVVLRLTPTNTPEDASFQSRATVTEVYEQIEQDLLASLDAIDNGDAPYMMNKGAAHALLGKVYLYWERWADAEEQFALALENTSATLTTNYADAFRGGVPHPESLFELNFNQSTEMAGVAGVNNSLYSYTHPNGTNDLGVSTYGSQTPSAELRSLFEITELNDAGHVVEANDDRAFLFFQRAASTSSAQYWWVDKYASSNGVYTDNVKIIRYADVLLMKAEAHVMQGETAEAVSILTQLRTSRDASTEVIPSDDNDALLSFIKEERRRELYFEGQRWFDLKRWANGISKPEETAIGYIAHSDFRLLAPLPNAEVVLNESLEQNPGY